MPNETSKSKTTPIKIEDHLTERFAWTNKKPIAEKVMKTKTTTQEIIADIFAVYLSSAERAYKEHEKAASEVIKVLEKAGYTICQKN